MIRKILLIQMFAASLLCAQTNDSPNISAVDGYAARVNNTIITYGDIRENVAPYLQQILQSGEPPDMQKQAIERMYLNAREALIEEALLKAEVRSLDTQLPQKFVDQEVQRLIRERFNGDRVLLARALREQRMTFEEWEKDVAEQLTLQIYYRDEVTRRASVSESDVRKEYERIRADYLIPFRVKYRAILINKGETEEEQAVKRQQAEQVLEKLKNGADFAALAENVSEGDPAVTPWRDPDDLVPALRPALRNTPAGETSGLIKTDDRYYIVRVEERREEGYVPFDEVKDEIHERLLNAERQRLHDELIERLAAKYYVERY